MQRALLAVVVLTGCSLQTEGTAESIPVDDTGAAVVDTSIQTDSAVVEDTAAAMDTFIEDTFIEETVAPVDTAPEVMDAGCAPKGSAKPCDEIAHREALASGQTMDGAPEDFCDVPYVDFDNSKGAVRSPDPTPGAATTAMRIRVAWSSYGLHAHLAVTDPRLLPRKPLTDNLVFLGDSVEIYVAGHTALTGAFDSTSKDLGAQQIIFTSPDTTTMSRAVYFYMGTATGSPDINRWKARMTGTGYDVELRLPWSELKAPSMSAPTKGSHIALSFAFNNKYEPTVDQAFSVFQVKAGGPPSPSTCTSGAQPFCDDRMWCTPKLL